MSVDKMPPYGRLLGITVEPAADGAAPVLLMPASEAVLGRPGFLHGGALAGLMEIAAVMGLYARLAEEDGTAKIKPINVSVDFMRGGKMVETRAQVVVNRLGRRVANVEASAWQEDREAPIAAARINFLIRRAGTV